MKHFLAFLFIILYSSSGLVAQNLVDNPGFEKREALDCLSCHIYNEEFSKKMSPWRNLNTHTTICDCNYKKKSTEGKYKYSEVCPFEKIKPKEGCAMIQMGYQPTCTDWDHATKGCASYLATELTEKLQMGKQYEISYWLYIAEPKDLGYEKHIGFTLFPKKIRNPKGAMIPQNVFQIDTIIYNQWYQVSWKIQPTCPLQYLVLGVFRGVDGPPTHNINRPANNYYFIDQVEVKEIARNDADLQNDVSFFCKPDLVPGLSVREEIEGFNAYFESGQDQLLAIYQTELDSFAFRAKQYPKSTFVISGHTDNVGSDHLALSKRRIDQVLSYLKSKHKIPSLRFICLPKGDGDPKTSNATEEGKQANRRVEIQQVDYPIERVIYRHLLNYVFQNELKLAKNALNTWLHFAPHKSKLLMLNDPRIDVLKNEPYWTNIIGRVRDSYQQFPLGINLSYSLDSLWAEDQKFRTLKYYIENLGTYLAPIDSANTKLKVNFNGLANEESSLDLEHLKALSQLLGKNNWVKQSEVGERAATANFLVIQHSMDLDLLKTYLPLLKERCMEGEASWNYFAMMYDRLQTIQNLPQRYGTQYKMMGDQQELFPLEDPERVNEWRNELGLSPL